MDEITLLKEFRAAVAPPGEVMLAQARARMIDRGAPGRNLIEAAVLDADPGFVADGFEANLDFCVKIKREACLAPAEHQPVRRRGTRVQAATTQASTTRTTTNVSIRLPNSISLWNDSSWCGTGT